MALLSQGTTSRHKHIFLKGIVAKLPETERETPNTLFSLFPKHLLPQLTIWGGVISQMDIKLYVDTEPFNPKHLSRNTSLCHLAEYPQDLQMTFSHTRRRRYRRLPSSTVIVLSSSERIKHTSHKTNTTQHCTDPSTHIPHRVSCCNVAILEKSTDKDRATLTVHIHHFENTLQRWTRIRPTKCTWTESRSSYPLHFTFRLQEKDAMTK